MFSAARERALIALEIWKIKPTAGDAEHLILPVSKEVPPIERALLEPLLGEAPSAAPCTQGCTSFKAPCYAGYISAGRNPVTRGPPLDVSQKIHIASFQSRRKDERPSTPVT